MNRKYILLLFISLMSIVNVSPQTIQDATINENFTNKYSNEVLKGLVLDGKDQSPLPYANIYLLNKEKGVISNEIGHFSINISDCKETDTLSISYIGYKTKNLTIEKLKNYSIISLAEDYLMLNNITVFGSAPDPKTIVKKVIENRETNYQKTSYKKQIFLRERNIINVKQINFNCKKSSISNLNEEMFEVLENEIPKRSISYTDFLGDIFLLNQESNSIKIEPIKIIELEEKKDITKLGELEDTFKDIFINTNDDEYWKIKTGIIGGKVHIGQNSVTIGGGGGNTDSLSNKNIDPFRHQKRTIGNISNYSSLDDEDKWEFLYTTNKYQYTLYGVTVANGEDVYIIDFKPNNRGKFIGRMYISMNTFALVRADYEYDNGKTGQNIQFLGMGYTKNKFSASVYFEKNESTYKLKYCSKTEGYNYNFDRALSLVQKKERFLFDRKVNQIKVGIDIGVSEDLSIEILVLEEDEISREEFTDFKENDSIEIIYVDKFDEKLWKDYPIIEPTKQMKEYKKLN